MMRVDKLDKQMKCAVSRSTSQFVELRENYTERVVNVICARIKTSIKFLPALSIFYIKSRKVRVDALELALVKGQGALKRGCWCKI